jgi:pyridoxamine 5'-phosphate oxidase
VRPPLPEPLPDDPLPLVDDWLREATATLHDGMAMTLATVGAGGRPTARMVICRGFDVAAGFFVFYTDRESDKGRALAIDPHAALVFHWDALERQLRVEGPVTAAPEADSDRYWASRPREARIAAIASAQSRPLAARGELLALIAGASESLGPDPPRPPRWGGYRVWAERVELWVGQPARAHDRAVWVRTLAPGAAGFIGSPWRGTRLMP